MKGNKKFVKLNKIVLYGFLDAFSVLFSWTIAILLSNGNLANGTYNIWYFVVIGVVLAMVFNIIFGLSNKILRYIDVDDLVKVFLSGSCECVYFGIVAVIDESLGLPWFIICSILYVIALTCSRFVYKIYGLFGFMARVSLAKKKGIQVMIVGAGNAGRTIIKEIKSSDKINMYPACAIDDDEGKIGQDINGVRVVGNTTEIEKYAEKYKIEQIIITMPSVKKDVVARILAECQKTNCKVKILPGVYQLVNGNVSIKHTKDVEITDLLGREPVKVNLDEIMGYIENKVVLVTGGGGSIGSELCRQIATHSPKKLIIVDIYENNAYDIQQELRRKLPDLNLEVLIASVRDAKRIDSIFNKYKPEIVFHAAAHKHVPLMEDSSCEAVKNNVGGTYKVADAAGRFGVKKFILISTDKAVNPTNVMGATKRICEMIIQSFNDKYETDYVAVRFGNVLGSNGSVIPLFRKQIKEGGPITVTDKEIVRYFMTIPEAVSLVLQAGAYAKGGEIFVLDMGEQVKIYDLAINMIKLSGYEPFKDIDIVITGLRPGEKLYEERLMDEEGLKKTENEKISIGKPLSFDRAKFFENVSKLVEEAYNENDKIKQLIKELVPTYKIDKREN